MTASQAQLALLCTLLGVVVAVTPVTAQEHKDFDRRTEILNKLPEDQVETLRYGTIFKKVAVLDLSASQWPHIIRIPRLPPVPDLKEYGI